MHMADALLSPAVAATMYVASGTTVGLSVKKLTEDENTQKLPTMAVASALVFAGQMINYTIPGTGSSGHMCGGMLLSALLGPGGLFVDGCGADDPVSLFCRRRAYGAWRQHMEHGILRMLCGILSDLAPYYEKQSV